MTVLTFRDVSKFANVNPAIVKKNNNKLFRKLFYWFWLIPSSDQFTLVGANYDSVNFQRRL